MGVKPESHFIGADLRGSGYGKFQSSQTRIVFELMTQEGTALKSWIHNCGVADELYHPGVRVTADGKIAGKQTQRMFFKG